MTAEENIKWRTDLELKYVLICKFCSRKVIDPDKSNGNQIFTKSKCPHCGMSKEQVKSKVTKTKCRIKC